MANNTSLTQENVRQIIDAFSHFFPEGTIYSTDESYRIGEFNWNNRKDFINFIYRLTGVEIKSEHDFQNIKKAQLAVGDLAETEEKKPESNTLTPEQLEQFEEERLKRSASQKEAVDNAKKAVEAAIKRQQELAESLKNKNVYVKVKAPETTQATDEEQNSIRTLKEAAKADPKRLVDQITSEIENKIISSNPQASPSEIHTLARQAAYNTVRGLRGSSLGDETVISNAIAKGESIVASTISDTDNINPLQEVSSKVANNEVFEYNLNRQLVASTFGESFTNNVFGPENLDNLNVEFSNKPADGFTIYNLSQIPSNFSATLGNQRNFLGSIKDFGAGEIKSMFLDKASTFLEDRIATLPSDSLLFQTYNNELVQGALSFFGLEGSAVTWEGTSFLGSIAVENGFGPILGWLGERTGIDFGIARISGAIGEEVVGGGLFGEAVVGVAAGEVGGVVGGEAVGIAAGEVAGTVVGEATGAAVGAVGGTGAGALAGLAGGPFAPITVAFGAISGWIASKIPWGKVKKAIPFILGGLLGFGVYTIAGVGAGTIAGLGTIGLTSALGGGGISFSSIGTGIAGFFGALTGATISAIGIPILTTLLVFPVVVALILFIINSGAYIVPPGQQILQSTNPYMEITKTATPAGPFKNTDLPIKISYQVTVTAKKGQLTNVHFNNECKIITTKADQNCPSQTPTAPTAPISPSQSYIFTYDETYSGGNYQDSIVLDTFTVTADTSDAKDQETSGSATVSIGTPPTACLTINQNEWPASYYANIVSARSILVSKYSDYISKICLSYTSLTLKYNPSGDGPYWGWNHGSYIDFFQLGVKNKDDALYTLSHELGHSLAWGSKTAYIYASYLAYPGITTEAPYCFYKDTENFNKNESMPESIALYVIEPRCGNVQQKWPIHYQFLKKFIFN